MTSPHIRQSPACNFLFGEEEIKIINQIANSYSEEGNRLKAMEIYHYLFNYIKSHIMDGDILAVTLPLVAYNYSKCLGLEHCYDEAIEVAEQGRRCCIRNNKCQMLGGLLLNLGCVYHEKGDEEKGKDFIQRSYQIYRAVLIALSFVLINKIQCSWFVFLYSGCRLGRGGKGAGGKADTKGKRSQKRGKQFFHIGQSFQNNIDCRGSLLLHKGPNFFH